MCFAFNEKALSKNLLQTILYKLPYEKTYKKGGTLIMVQKREYIVNSEELKTLDVIIGKERREGFILNSVSMLNQPCFNLTKMFVIEFLHKSNIKRED